MVVGSLGSEPMNLKKKQQKPILGIRMKPTVVILLLILTYWHLAAPACKQNRLIVHRKLFSMASQRRLIMTKG